MKGNLSISEFVCISIVTYQWLLDAQLEEYFRQFSQEFERHREFFLLIKWNFAGVKQAANFMSLK